MRIGKPSPAMLVALIALFVALGGSSYAALNLPKGSVGSKQLQADSVSSPKVKPGSLLLSDFRASQRARLQGPQGIQGAQGPVGERGPTGARGAPGMSGLEQVFNVFTPFDSNSPKTATATCPEGKKVVAPLGLASGTNPAVETQVHLTQLFVSSDLTTVTVVAAEDQDGTDLQWFITPGAVCAAVAP